MKADAICNCWSGCRWFHLGISRFWTVKCSTPRERWSRSPRLTETLPCHSMGRYPRPADPRTFLEASRCKRKWSGVIFEEKKKTASACIRNPIFPEVTVSRHYGINIVEAPAGRRLVKSVVHKLSYFQHGAVVRCPQLLVHAQESIHWQVHLYLAVHVHSSTWMLCLKL